MKAEFDTKYIWKVNIAQDLIYDGFNFHNIIHMIINIREALKSKYMSSLLKSGVTL